MKALLLIIAILMFLLIPTSVFAISWEIAYYYVELSFYIVNTGYAAGVLAIALLYRYFKKKKRQDSLAILLLLFMGIVYHPLANYIYMWDYFFVYFYAFFVAEIIGSILILKFFKEKWI